MSDPGQEPDVPRLPRGRGLRLSGPALYRIIVMTALLVGVLVFGRTCANTTASFVQSFDPPAAAPASAETATTPPGDVTLIPLQGRSEAEIRQMVEAAQARARARTETPSSTPPQSPTTPAPAQRPLP